MSPKSKEGNKSKKGGRNKLIFRENQADRSKSREGTIKSRNDVSSRGKA